MSSTPSLTSSMTFDHASRAVVTYLHTHLPMGAWQVTRLENGRQMSLHLDEDNVYGLTRGRPAPGRAPTAVG